MLHELCKHFDTTSTAKWQVAEGLGV